MIAVGSGKAGSGAGLAGSGVAGSGSGLAGSGAGAFDPLLQPNTATIAATIIVVRIACHERTRAAPQQAARARVTTEAYAWPGDGGRSQRQARGPPSGGGPPDPRPGAGHRGRS